MHYFKICRYYPYGLCGGLSGTVEQPGFIQEGRGSKKMYLITVLLSLS